MPRARPRLGRRTVARSALARQVISPARAVRCWRHACAPRCAPPAVVGVVVAWPLPFATGPVSYGEAARQVGLRGQVGLRLVRREHRARISGWYAAGTGADAPRPRRGQNLASLLGVPYAGRGVLSCGRRVGQGVMETMQEPAHEARRTVPRRPRTARPAHRPLAAAGAIPLGHASRTHRERRAHHRCGKDHPAAQRAEPHGLDRADCPPHVIVVDKVIQPVVLAGHPDGVLYARPRTKVAGQVFVSPVACPHGALPSVFVRVRAVDDHRVKQGRIRRPNRGHYRPVGGHPFVRRFSP